MALVTLLLGLLGLLGGFAVAPAYAGPDDYQLTPTYPGDPMHIPILIYRHRHTVLKQEVSWDRNVAAFDFTHNGVDMVVVGPSIGLFPNNTKIALIDLYRLDPATGQWILVDMNSNPVTVNGQAVDWKISSEPSVAWDLRKELAVQKELKSGLHSEQIDSLYLQLEMDGANKTSKKGLSERIPCTSVNRDCRASLKNHEWFEALEDMRYLTNKPNTRKASKAGTESANTELKGGYETWSKAGMPTGSDAPARMGQRVFVTPGSPSPQGAAARALAPGSDPGGIDFSTLELRYLAEGSGGQLQYAFEASPAAASHHNIANGQTAAVQTSDAFFVWLSLPESTFWVNLNPSEPDRIIDNRLGTTDVGRILLQADFQMKKLVGQLIHPDTDLGTQFWGILYNPSNGCINMRQWIVPAPATVYEQNGELYIVDTPLQVKMETDYLKQQGETSSCITPDKQMESRFRTLVLPKVEEAVNHAPEFAELRRVYLSRVAAEWYRERHSHGGALSSMIDSGKVSAWPALQQWSPHQVFDQYVNSYQKKEFNITKRVTRSDTIYEATYTYGGVDFSNVVLNQAPQSLFQRDHSDLPGVVQQSFQQLATDHHGKVWLGSTVSSSRPGSGSHFTMYLLLAVIGGVAGAVWAHSWWRLRLARRDWAHMNPPVPLG
ncbi:MAG: hypothetical protein M3Q39_04095 [Actinomycetota bacterium]|nr:hypothetical protein [Actinomycetota bacterium]